MSSYELCCSEGPTVGENFLVFYTFFIRFEQNSVQELPTKCYRVIIN